ncbi:hypothetical protein AB1N83_006610 [Pleurotus pulmonarius]
MKPCAPCRPTLRRRLLLTPSTTMVRRTVRRTVLSRSLASAPPWNHLQDSTSEASPVTTHFTVRILIPFGHLSHFYIHATTPDSSF